MNKLILILFLISSHLVTQNGSPEFSVSGNLKVYFGTELLARANVIIQLTPGNKVTETDSLGNYKFDGLKGGKYILRVIEYNPNPKEFEILLNTKSITGFDLIVNADCPVNTRIAETEIKQGRPRLLLIGGVAPIITVWDSKFAKKYGIQFYDFGDTGPAEECVLQYNKEIFEYLDSKFGTKWRKEVRKDVIGLK